MRRLFSHQFSKTKIDNFGQTLTAPKVYHKSFEKLHSLDPKYGSLREDPHFRQVLITVDLAGWLIRFRNAGHQSLAA